MTVSELIRELEKVRKSGGDYVPVRAFLEEPLDSGSLDVVTIVDNEQEVLLILNY